MKRGEVWWAALPTPTGSGPGFRRPVVIIQANAFNDSRIETVIVATVTSQLARESLPGNVRLSKSDSGLSKASVVNISQIITIDRTMLVKKANKLTPQTIAKIDEGLRIVLSI